MSSKESPDSITHGIAPAGIIPATRPLRKPNTVNEEDSMPHVPSRPLRRSSTEKSKGLDVMERSSSIDEIGVSVPQENDNNELQETAPVIPNRPTHHEDVATDLEPIIPERPGPEPHVPARPKRKQTSLDAAIGDEPQIPSRPIKKVASVNEEAAPLPTIPAHPNLKNTESDIQNEDTIETEEKTAREIPSVSTNPTEEHAIPSRPTRITKHSTELTNEQEKETLAPEEKLQENINIDNHTDFTEPETEQITDDTELVEPLMPKRPMRRSTTEMSSPMVPHRPRKVATSIGLETVKRDIPLNVNRVPDESEEIEQAELEEREDAGGLDEEVKPVDVINTAALGGKEYALQKDHPDDTNLQEENKSSSTAKLENETAVEENPPAVVTTQLTDDKGLTSEESVSKEVEEEIVKKDIPESVVTETKPEATSEKPSVPSRPLRKGPPPVPKKPSSKIAAFHQMLQRQQMKNLGLAEEEEAAKTEIEPTNETPEPATITAQTEDKQTVTQPSAVPTRPSRIMGNNMNGMFALPGMVPGGMLPPGLSKKLGISTGESSNTNTENGSKGALSDVRQKRARGPRGRKLPSKISNIKKIVDTSENNEIEMFNTWKIVMTPQSMVEENTNIPLSSEGEILSQSDHISQENLNDVGAVSKEMKPNSLNDEIELLTTQSDVNEPSTTQSDVNEPIDIQRGFDIDRTQVETPVSIGEKIENRDEDEQAIAMEEKVEGMAEALMEQEMLKGNIDESEIEEFIEEELGEPETESQA